MALFFFVAAVASGCRRLLADSVTATAGAPRNLEELELHFESGDWAANGVLLLEADGDYCESGTGGDAHDGDFSASWDPPQDGCYRVDAHSAGEQCGFKSPVALTIDWCAGRTETLKYTPGADGWTALGVYPFHPGNLGGITQQEGAVDAFRVVPVPECKKANPVFGSLTIDTDAMEMPEDLASQLANRVVNMGDALTAFFHPQVEETRRLSAGDVVEEPKPSSTNHVVVDFDLSKLGSPFPTDATVKEAVELICGLLESVECGHSASFKLDESGEAKAVREKPPVAPLLLVVVASIAGVGLLVSLVAGTAMLAKQLSQRSVSAEPKSVFVSPKEEGVEDVAEEKKPQVEDDNVSTVTPTSIPDSLPSVDDTKDDQVV